jgi:hypothetical protein
MASAGRPTRRITPWDEADAGNAAGDTAYAARGPSGSAARAPGDRHAMAAARVAISTATQPRRGPRRWPLAAAAGAMMGLRFGPTLGSAGLLTEEATSNSCRRLRTRGKAKARVLGQRSGSQFPHATRSGVRCDAVPRGATQEERAPLRAHLGLPRRRPLVKCGFYRSGGVGVGPLGRPRTLFLLVAVSLSEGELSHACEHFNTTGTHIVPVKVMACDFVS